MQMSSRETPNPARTSREAGAEFMRMLEEMETNQSWMRKRYRDKITWESSAVGQIKVNMDGAWYKHSNNAGLGYIARDCSGKALIAVAAHHQSPTVLYFEILATKSAMYYAHANQEWKEKIYIESDREEAINFITGKCQCPPVETRILLEEIKFLAASNKFYLLHC